MPPFHQTISKFFTSSDGVKLHYLDRGIGPAILLLPGWTQPASSFGMQIEHFSKLYRCFALDYRGHGDSDKPDHGYRVS